MARTYHQGFKYLDVLFYIYKVFSTYCLYSFIFLSTSSNILTLPLPSLLSYISPQFSITISSTGTLPLVMHLSILSTISKPSTTLPNTTCFPSKCGKSLQQIKNWHPLLLGPELAMETLYFSWSY